MCYELHGKMRRGAIAYWAFLIMDFGNILKMIFPYASPIIPLVYMHTYIYRQDLSRERH